MDYISQSLTHFSKGNIECVLKCTKLLQKQAHGYMFQTNCSSIKQRYMTLGYFFKKRGNNKHTCPIFDNEFLVSSKKNVYQKLYFPNQTGGHM